MRVYPVPYLPEGEEKLVGGRLSVRQFLYLVAGGLAALLIARAGGRVAAVLPFAASAALAFGEVPSVGMRLDEYLVRLVRYEAGTKVFVLRGR